LRTRDRHVMGSNTHAHHRISGPLQGPISASKHIVPKRNQGKRMIANPNPDSQALGSCHSEPSNTATGISHRSARLCPSMASPSVQYRS